MNTAPAAAPAPVTAAPAATSAPAAALSAAPEVHSLIGSAVPAAVAGNPVTPSGEQAPITDWRTKLPEELRGHTALKDFKDEAAAIKAYVDVQPLIGSKLTMPKADAPQEEWDKFHAKLGRPEKAEEYKMPQVELPQGVKVDEKLQQGALGIFHRAGLSQKQAETVYSDFLKLQVANAPTAVDAKKELEDTEKALRGEWKGEFDARMNGVNEVASKFGGADFVKWIASTNLGRNVNFLKFMDGIRGKFVEDKASGSGSNHLTSSKSQAAQEELNQMHNDPELVKALMDSGHPKHDSLLKRRIELFKLAGGTE